MPEYEYDANYGTAQPIALSALGRPKRYFHCLSIMFDKGGDSGYWMRLLGHDDFQYRRVGSLVITGEAVAYGELCARRPKPRSGAGALVTMALGKNKFFADFEWTARKEELNAITVHPVCTSPHGAYAAVEIGIHEQRVRFGLDVGHPHAQDCISALRHLAGEELTLEGSTGAPRSDGAYLMASNTRAHGFQAIVIHDSRANIFSLGNVRKNLDNLRSGAWDATLFPLQQVGDHYVIEHDDPSKRRHLWVQHERLVAQVESARDVNDEYGARTSEFLFVSDSELVPGWGLPTIPWPIPAPAWSAVLSQNGDIVAESI